MLREQSQRGVYMTRCKVGQETLDGIMNIGYRPTVGGRDKTIEIHLLDFEGDLYGKTIRAEVLKRLRDEQKFESVDELSRQIRADETKARNWFRDLK